MSDGTAAVLWFGVDCKFGGWNYRKGSRRRVKAGGFDNYKRAHSRIKVESKYRKTTTR